MQLLGVGACIGDGCLDNELLLKITRRYKGESDNESVYLWEGDSESGLLVFLQNGKGLKDAETTTSLCVKRAHYVLSLVSLCVWIGYIMYSRENGWAVGSRVVVTSYRDIVLVDTVLNSYSNRDIRLDCDTQMAGLSVGRWDVTPSTVWRVSDAFQASWMMPYFNDDAWDENQRGGFSNITSHTVTRYYRCSFPLDDDFASFAGFRFLVNLKFGIVMYMNGQEVFRHNLQSSSFSNSFHAQRDHYAVHNAQQHRERLHLAIVLITPFSHSQGFLQRALSLLRHHPGHARRGGPSRVEPHPPLGPLLRRSLPPPHGFLLFSSLILRSRQLPRLLFSSPLHRLYSHLPFSAALQRR